MCLIMTSYITYAPLTPVCWLLTLPRLNKTTERATTSWCDKQPAAAIRKTHTRRRQGISRQLLQWAEETTADRHGIALLKSASAINSPHHSSSSHHLTSVSLSPDGSRAVGLWHSAETCCACCIWRTRMIFTCWKRFQRFESLRLVYVASSCIMITDHIDIHSFRL